MMKETLKSFSTCKGDHFDLEVFVSLLTENYILTLKVPIMTAADDIHKYFFIVFQKLRLDALSESSARQRIHRKNRLLFSLKDKSKKIIMSSAAIFVWPLKG